MELIALLVCVFLIAHASSLPAFSPWSNNIALTITGWSLFYQWLAHYIGPSVEEAPAVFLWHCCCMVALVILKPFVRECAVFHKILWIYI